MAKSSELVVLTRQWAMLLSSGVPLIEGLSLLENQLEESDLKTCLAQVVRKISSGYRLSSSLSAYPQWFGPVFLAMVRLGEEVGGLNVAMLRLAEWLERDQKMAHRWRSALMYPAFVLGVSALLLVLLFVLVVPAFVDVFAAFQMPLPLVTRILLGLGSWSRNPLTWLVLGLAGLEVYRQLRLRWPEQKGRCWDLPGIGPLYRAAVLGRLCLALECTVSVGMPLLKAWKIAAQVSGCPRLEQDSERVLRCCKDGESLTEALEVSPLYPSNLVEMVRTGEEVGLLAPLMARLRDLYDLELEHRVAIFTALIEPVLLSGLALVVVFIVMSLMMPLYFLIAKMTG